MIASYELSTDWDLLDDYLAGSQDAFTELVRRHSDLVYSAALRQVRDACLAEDVTQAVFLLLLQKARSIDHETILPAWLHQATRYCASNARRLRANRQRHELRAAQMSPPHLDPTVEANAEDVELSALVDEAVGRLNSRDRKAVILRFFAGKNNDEIGAALCISREAARKRVDRAIVRLRRNLSRLGARTTTSSLAGFLASHCAGATPSHLISSLTTGLASASGVSAASATTMAITQGAIRMLLWAKVRTAATVAAIVLLFVGTGVTTVVILAEHNRIPAHREDPGQSISTPAPQTRPQLSDTAISVHVDPTNESNILTYADGSVYRGEFKNGLRDGTGTMAWASGTRKNENYQGEWKADTLDGAGALTYADGSRYHGEFKEGKREGKGTMRWASGPHMGDEYDGEWKADNPEGRGIYTHADGSQYIGEFKDGKIASTQPIAN